MDGRDALRNGFPRRCGQAQQYEAAIDRKSRSLTKAVTSEQAVASGLDRRCVAADATHAHVDALEAGIHRGAGHAQCPGNLLGALALEFQPQKLQVTVEQAGRLEQPAPVIQRPPTVQLRGQCLGQQANQRAGGLLKATGFVRSQAQDAEAARSTCAVYRNEQRDRKTSPSRSMMRLSVLAWCAGKAGSNDAQIDSVRLAP